MKVKMMLMYFSHSIVSKKINQNKFWQWCAKKIILHHDVGLII